jgi:outer membrane usher protein
MAQDARAPPAAEEAPPPGSVQLVLLVNLNGQTQPSLSQFEQLPDGGLAIDADQLRELGLIPERMGVAPGTRLVALDHVQGLRYSYDVAHQSIDIRAIDAVLVPRVLDTSSAPIPLDASAVRADPGAMLNYSIFVQASSEQVAVSGNYQVRLLAPFGIFSSDGVAYYSSTGVQRSGHVRFDTYFRHVDTEHVRALTIGDLIGGGGDLGAVYRLGGIQLQRNFPDRPDLVTTALPVLGGSAAVPSTIDLYVNGLRYFSGATAPGPFQFRSLPNLGGGGEAEIVLTDAMGRETRIKKPLYFAPGLLPRGMLDYSVEAGFPRLNYGVDSFHYLNDPAASASLRYGLTDALTIRVHGEGMHDFVNGSAGLGFRIGAFGVFSASGAASEFRGVTDTQYSLAFQGWYRGINFYGGIERSNAGYQDVVTVTSIKAGYGPQAPLAPQSAVTPVVPPLLAFSRATDRAGLSFNIASTGVGLSYNRLQLQQDQNLRIASLSLSRAIGRVSIHASAYKDFGDQRDYGIFAGINLSIGRISASSDVSNFPGGSSLTTRVSSSPPQSEGAIGWNVVDSETLSGPSNSYRAATLHYQAPFAVLQGGVEQLRDEVRFTGYIEGSIAAMGGGVYAAPRIDNAFAVVRGAGPHTPVVLNTRTVATTDASGSALVPYLAPYQRNVVGIDPTKLPVDVKPARTEMTVVPADRSGVVIDFDVKPIADAIVTLVGADGKQLPVGAFVTLEGNGETAVVGYDGQVYLTGLAPQNHVTVQGENEMKCSASFDYHAIPGSQVRIGPVTCK